MKILFLGPETSPLIPWLREAGEEVVHTSERVSMETVTGAGLCFLVSYGYRHIIEKDVLDLFPSRAINLHISYLPWNRGADPNFWSFVEDSPKGVSIHYLDEGIDTGDLLVQKEVCVDSSRDTLASSYDKLHEALQDLFKRNWNSIKSGSSERRRQTGEGSAHKVRDKEALSHLLTAGWNTPVSVLEDYGRRNVSVRSVRRRKAHSGS